MPTTPAKPSTAPIATPAQTAAFITRWQGVTASDLSTAQRFVIDLCALLGVDFAHAAYAEAIREGYRFFSYGDAMLILNARR